MAMKMLAVFLVGTVLFFDATNALSCINCMYDSAGGSGSDSNCGETTSVAATDCGSTYTYDSCAKIYTKHILTGRIQIMRYCNYNVYPSDDKAATNECASSTLRGTTSTTCYCTKDSCNAGFRDVSPLPVLMLAAALLTSAILYFK